MVDPAKQHTLDLHPSIESGMMEKPLVPGTLHLVDLEGILRAKHASGSESDIVLIPAPSEDPDDPLNWSAERKLLSTASISMCVCYPLLHHVLMLRTSYTFAIGTTSAAIYSILGPIEKNTGLTLNDLNAGTGYMVRNVQYLCHFDAKRIAVSTVRVGLLVLAASRATVRKAACVSNIDASNNSESKVKMIRFVLKADALV